MRGRVRFLVVTLAATAVLAAGAYAKPKPVTHIGTAVPHTQRTGHGLIRFDGHGPEWWAWEARKARRHARRLERQLQHRFHRDVDYALRLASAAYGVPLSELRSVAACETGNTFSPYAVNGQYRGLFQEGPMFEAGPFGRAGFSVWDPVANAMTAAYTVARESWQQWECQPR